MSSLRPQDRKSLSRFTFADGRQCRTPRSRPGFDREDQREIIPSNPFRINTYTMPASVDSKPLTETLSPLDATLMKNRGEGSCYG